MFSILNFRLVASLLACSLNLSFQIYTFLNNYLYSHIISQSSLHSRLAPLRMAHFRLLPWRLHCFRLRLMNLLDFWWPLCPDCHRSPSQPYQRASSIWICYSSFGQTKFATLKVMVTMTFIQARFPQWMLNFVGYK